MGIVPANLLKMKTAGPRSPNVVRRPVQPTGQRCRQRLEAAISRIPVRSRHGCGRPRADGPDRGSVHPRPPRLVLFRRRCGARGKAGAEGRQCRRADAGRRDAAVVHPGAGFPSGECPATATGKWRAARSSSPTSMRTRPTWAKLLLTEFALVYGNDWCVIPYELPVGFLERGRGYPRQR